MKKLLPIFGHIFPLNITPFNGLSKIASAKSITLSQKFQKINFSHFFKNSGIIPVDIEFSNLAEIFRRTVTELKIARINRKEILRFNHSVSNDNFCLTKTQLTNFTVPAISIPGYKKNNSIPGTMIIFRNKYQNTF